MLFLIGICLLLARPSPLLSAPLLSAESAEPPLSAPPLASLASSVCRVQAPHKAFVVLTLEGLEDPQWHPRCEAWADYLKLPAPPLPTEQDLPQRSQKALEALGYFSSVRCSQPDAALLACYLKPAIMVTGFKITGHVPWNILKQDLKQRVFLRPGTVLSHPSDAFKKQSQRLEKVLTQQGYFGSQIRVRSHRVSGAEPNQGVELELEVHPGSTARLRSVEIQGDHVLEDARLADVFHHSWFLKLGAKPFQPEQFYQDVQTALELLQDQGWPAARLNASFKRDPAAAAVDVTVQVQSGPYLRLAWVGSTVFRESQLQKMAPFVASQAVDLLEIEAFSKTMQQRYQEKGYPHVSITYDVQRPNPHALTVTYVIHEARQAHIKHRTLTGNVHISEAHILKEVPLMTQPSHGLIAHRWVDAWVEQDIQRLTDFYHVKGFASAHVTARCFLWGQDPSEDLLEAVFTIEEGPRQYVASVRLEGYPPHAQPEALLQRLTLRRGFAYQASQLDADVQEIRAVLASYGFLKVQVQPSIKPSRNPSDGSVDITYTIQVGPQARYAGLWTRGNLRTRRSVFVQELGLKQGALLDVTVLGAGQRRLRSFDLFHGVRLVPLEGEPQDPQTWLLLTLEERDVRSLDAVVSFSSDNLWSIGADFSDHNLWGRAMAWDVQLRLANASGWFHPRLRWGSQDRMETQLRAQRPWGLPVDTEATAFYHVQDRTLFRERRLGGTASLTRVVMSRQACAGCPAIIGRLGYELTEVSYAEKPAHALSQLSQDPHPLPFQTMARLVPSVELDRRDSLVDPRQGYAANLRFEMALPLLAGPWSLHAASFWRLGLSGQFYLPIFQRQAPAGHIFLPWESSWNGILPWGGPWVVAGFLNYSMAQPWGSAALLPASETLSYGGDFNVRGLIHQASRVATPDATALWVGSIELRWYLLPNLGIGALQVGGFVDTGTAAYRVRDLFKQTTLSLGPVIRYVMPVGPLSLAYGWPVVRPSAMVRNRPDVAPSRGRFHISFGYNF